MSTYLRAWNKGSASAEALSDELDIPRIKHQGSRFVGAAHKTVINWGCSTLPEQILECNVINKPEAVTIASDKRKSLTSFNQNGVSTVPWTTSREEAQVWLADSTVVARTIINASGGKGIVVVDPGEELPRAPLYTLYRKKAKEFRIHVAFGRVIDVQQKCLSAEFKGRDDINWKIRNLENGFIFRRNNINIPLIVKVEAIRAVRGMGLDFGAVDIGYNERHDVPYVYEVNTAPGLVGSTIKSYAQVFKRRLAGELPNIPDGRIYDDENLDYHINFNADREDELVENVAEKPIEFEILQNREWVQNFNKLEVIKMNRDRFLVNQKPAQNGF